MSDGAHLLIPFAFAGAPGCRQALESLPLPRLEKLLERLTAVELDTDDSESLSMPHERVIAREAGVAAADGCLPLAAMEASDRGLDATGAAWAWITPCHWRVATDHITMSNPADLALDESESRAMLAAMAPFFEEDGIALDYESPLRWLARGELFRGMACASLDRVSGRDIDIWMPRSTKAAPLRRLQQEMQMLLYTHETNEAREQRGLLPVNSFWVSGAGAVDAPLPIAKPLRIVNTLREPALRGDWASWGAAWAQLDVAECATLLDRVDRGEPVSLTLCGERSAQTWTHRAPAGHLAAAGRRIANIFSRKKAASAIEQL